MEQTSKLEINDDIFELSLDMLDDMSIVIENLGTVQHSKQPVTYEGRSPSKFKKDNVIS